LRRVVEPDHDEARDRVLVRRIGRRAREPDVVGRVVVAARAVVLELRLDALNRADLLGQVVVRARRAQTALRVAVRADVDGRERGRHATAGTGAGRADDREAVVAVLDRLVGAFRIAPVVVLDDVALAAGLDLHALKVEVARAGPADLPRDGADGTAALGRVIG